MDPPEAPPSYLVFISSSSPVFTFGAIDFSALKVDIKFANQVGYCFMDYRNRNKVGAFRT